MVINNIFKKTGQEGGYVGTGKMPVLFLGHGSPMNAIEENSFVHGFREVAKTIPKPKAILCLSAHWETKGTFVTSIDFPPTIHDFGGFPKALYEIIYPAKGSPDLATETVSLVKTTNVGTDPKRGLDHGAWSVIKHLYPAADVPVVQISIDYLASPQGLYNMMKELSSLREKGILVIGSGNMVHNLAMIDWENFGTDNYAYDWALEAVDMMKGYILGGDYKQLINYRCHGKAFELAIPTPEHYLPLLGALALKEENDPITLFNDKSVAGSISMTSVKIG